MSMFSCKDTAQLISDALDRRLSLWQRLGLRMHLLMCSLCARFRGDMSFLQEVARRFEEARDQTVTLSPQARERIKRVLEEQSQ